MLSMFRAPEQSGFRKGPLKVSTVLLGLTNMFVFGLISFWVADFSCWKFRQSTGIDLSLILNEDYLYFILISGFSRLHYIANIRVY